MTITASSDEEEDYRDSDASLPTDIEVEDQPDGGANALNVNRYLLRALYSALFLRIDDASVFLSANPSRSFT